MAETNLQQLTQTLRNEHIQKRFNEMLGKKSAGFLSSISNVVNNNGLLQKADVNSIVLAASQAASLDLPINPNLGYAAIVPFYDSKTRRNVATFQIMVNGFVELAMRSGQFLKLTCSEVYEGELVYKNRFTDEYRFDESCKKSNTIVGYMAYMKLVNGFEKTVYWTIGEVKEHGMRYSQTFKKGTGLWVTDFNKMAKKTILKNLIVKFAPKSIEMLNAIENDQASFSGDINNPNAVYVDNNNDEQIEVQEFVEVVEEETQKHNSNEQVNKPDEEGVEF